MTVSDDAGGTRAGEQLADERLADEQLADEQLADEQVADEQLAAFVAEVRRDPGPSARELGAAELRRAQRERVLARPGGPEVGSVRDLKAGPNGVPVREYRPAADDSRGTVVFLHGGMWVIGDLDSHDRLCRRMVHATGVAVIAVDYRRAPEHVWPAAVDDTVAVLRAVRDDAGATLGGTGPLAVMGDSAGGHLATLACLRLRDAGEPLPALQVLAYPNTDLTLSHPSVRTKGTGWGLDADAVAWGAELWVPDPARRADPAVSPLYADLRGLPPAIVVTAEHDPLRDEGDAYAARLAESGVEVRHRCEAGQLHGFLTMDALSGSAASAGERLFAELADRLTHPAQHSW